MNKIINQRYIYYPYLIKPADLMLARLMYDLVRKKDLEDLNKNRGNFQTMLAV